MNTPYTESWIYHTNAWELAGMLVVLIILFIYLGFRLGRHYGGKDNHRREGTSVIIPSLLGLFAFLLAFTFSMSGSRYDKRRELIINEANAIGTAILRADLFPEADRALLRADFRKYVEARIAYFEAGRDEERVREAMKQSSRYAADIWKRCAGLSRIYPTAVSAQMIAAMNVMIDIANERHYQGISRVPDSIIIMLFILAVASAFYTGYSAGLSNFMDWLAVTGFSLLTVLVIYITLDLDRPRRGLINMKGTHQAMLDLRKMFADQEVLR